MSESIRRPTFFRITVGLFALLVLFGIAMAVILVLNADRINRDGGYGWLGAALLFLVATILVCVGAAVCSAISLRRGEAHRGFSTVVLIVSCLVVFVFGSRMVATAWSQWRMSQEDARTRQEQPRRVAGEGGTEIPDALVGHFRRQGFSIRPALERSSNREYILDGAGVGTRCEVIVKFRGFARAAPVELINKKLMEFNAASVLNEQARLAMFYPFARGKNSDKDACEPWAVKSKDIVEPLLDAFRSYRP